MTKEDVIFNLIEQECKKHGFAIGTTIFKMAGLLNIDYDKTNKIILDLCYQKKIEREGMKKFWLI